MGFDLEGKLYGLLHLFTLFHGAPEQNMLSINQKVPCEHSKLLFIWLIQVWNDMIMSN